MKVKRNFGLGHKHQDAATREQLIGYINMKLAALGWPVYHERGTENLTMAQDLIRNFREKNRLLDEYLPPADQRIQNWLDGFLADLKLDQVPRLPSNTLVLDRYGLSRELSLPPDADKFQSGILTTYRLKQGVLHNPLNDRRTTKGVFHVAEGGLPVPPDKKAVPKAVFAKLLAAALNPPEELSTLPFTGNLESKAKGFTSLLLRPLVSPEVKGWMPEKSMEIRFFAPGNLVSNLDFVESIFGNAGDPYLPENDSALDPFHWSGHTGCIILATHLISLRKKDLGLPHWDKATDRQKADGMAWKSPDELYNDGSPFKITARDKAGVMVTLIADNYYGYSKKEVKTQISYAANLMGLAEEEHAGGALAFPSFNLGVRFVMDTNLKDRGQTLTTVKKLLGDNIVDHPDGYAVDKRFSDVIYIPESAQMHLEDQQVSWRHEGRDITIKLLPGKTYVHPTGYRIHMEQHPGTKAWRLVGTSPEGTLCHKPCTVSGGGKSEISKSIWDAIHFMPIFINDFKKDMDAVEEILNKDYGNRFKEAPDRGGRASRPILSELRSLGSVVKLLTPNSLFTAEYNKWLDAIPSRIKALVFLVKRFYLPEWEGEWRDKFSVDVVNGTNGNIFKFNGRPIAGSFLRVGLRDDGTWWNYKLRQDFMPASKIQWEDDITASVVVPSRHLEYLNPEYSNPSVKIAENCEFRFFQRPDEAIHRGYDKQAEADLAGDGNFISNFEPFERSAAQDFVDNAIAFSEYTKPVQDTIQAVADNPAHKYFIVSSHPRIVDGAPSKNPRYLQMDPNHLNPKARYLADIGVRLFREIPADKPVHHPVNAVLPGRRNNPPDHKAGIRPLAVYNPIHYQELPELFMDFICSLTGKSPSTTGAGSEGALTKGPFNALVPTTDLNNALLSFILTGYNGFSSAAGHIGPKYRVDHDISLLVPEIWCRMTETERDPAQLIKEKSLEKLTDFDYKGRKVLASRLGYRITYDFAAKYLARIFDDPGIVFNEEMLKPEIQNLDDYVDGIDNVVEAQRKVAKDYLADGSVKAAIPPLQALLHIMAEGSWNGKDAQDPAVRQLFDRDTVLKSDWYKARLTHYRDQQLELAHRNRDYIKSFIRHARHQEEAQRLGLENTLAELDAWIKKLGSKDYLESLVGTIGADPLFVG